MIEDFGSVFKRFGRQPRIAEGRPRLRLSGNLAGNAVRYPRFYPTSDSCSSAIVKAKIFYLRLMACGLKRLADIVCDAKNKIVSSGEVLGVEPEKFFSQPVSDGNGAGAHRFGVHADNGNGFSNQIDVTPAQTEDLPCPHARVQGADYDASQLGLRVKEQSRLLFAAQNSLPRHLISHRDQAVTIIKRRALNPSHAYSSFEHPSKQGHFPVDTGNLSLTTVSPLGRSFQAQCFVVLEIVVSNAREALRPKERLERCEMKERGFVAPHPCNLATVNIHGLNEVTLSKHVCQVIKRASVTGTYRFTSERDSQVALTAIARFCFGSAGAPEGMPLTVSARVRGFRIDASNLLAILLNNALDNRKPTLPHLISTLVSAFSENVRPDAALNSTDRLAKATRMAVNFPLLAGTMRYNRWIVDQASDSSQSWTNKRDRSEAKSESLLSSTLAAVLVQSVRTPDCGSGGRGFESHIPPQLIEGSRLYGVGLFSFAP